MDTPIYFSSNNIKIKNLLKERGLIICNHISRETLLKSLSEFNNGFIILSEREIKGFVLLKSDSKSYSMNIELLCVNESYREIEQLLLDYVLDFCIKHDFVSCTLFALPFDEIINFYESNKFRNIYPVNIRGEIKAYYMIKLLNSK